MNISRYFHCLLVAVVVLCVVGCSPESDEPTVETADQTVVMFFPWSSTLLGDLGVSVRDMSNALARRGLKGQRVLVCMSTAESDAVLFELRCKNGRCVADTLRRYTDHTFTSRGDMTSLFSYIKAVAPANRYGLIVGGHGMGWIRRSVSPRYFGGLTAAYEIETTDFAAALSDAGFRPEYILFDNCYMSSVEVAYELKDVAHYIIASPTEIMSYGFPYAKCCNYLLGSVDYRGIVDAFMEYYSSSSSPYAAVAVTDCTQLDSLARVMRKVNSAMGEGGGTTNGVQAMDGYTPTLFYDFGHYVQMNCSDASLLTEFQLQLDKAVPYREHTDKYYTMSGGENKILHYSGLNTSQGSNNSLAAGYSSTAWYLDTKPLSRSTH